MSAERTEDLTALRRHILTLGSTVEQRVASVHRAMTNRDAQTAKVVRRADTDIDRAEVAIEEECLRVLALIHPVASDLRLVLCVLRVNTELERIGDLAKSIAKRVIDLKKIGAPPTPELLIEMSKSAQSMFANALSALADDDAELARTVLRSDDEVDKQLKGMFQWAQHAIPNQVEQTNAIIDQLSIARKLERIADHTTNIAESVIFLNEGSVVRHSHT